MPDWVWMIGLGVAAAMMFVAGIVVLAWVLTR
jgi:hypothetical protein